MLSYFTTHFYRNYLFRHLRKEFLEGYYNQKKIAKAESIMRENGDYSQLEQDSPVHLHNNKTTSIISITSAFISIINHLLLLAL